MNNSKPSWLPLGTRDQHHADGLSFWGEVSDLIEVCLGCFSGNGLM